jgi:hypothetical protein
MFTQVSRKTFLDNFLTHNLQKMERLRRTNVSFGLMRVANVGCITIASIQRLFLNDYLKTMPGLLLNKVICMVLI